MEYEEYEPVKATGWLIATFIFVLTGGLFAVIFGFSVYNSKVKLSDGSKEHKYIDSHRQLGLLGGILGIISFVVWQFASL